MRAYTNPESQPLAKWSDPEYPVTYKTTTNIWISVDEEKCSNVQMLTGLQKPNQQYLFAQMIMTITKHIDDEGECFHLLFLNMFQSKSNL